MKTCILVGALAIGILLTATTARCEKRCCCNNRDARRQDDRSAGSVDSTTNNERHYDEPRQDHRSGHEEGGNSVSADSEGPQTPEMKSVLNLTNAYRRKVARGEVENQPPNSDIRDLKWNAELARMAQEFANLCTFNHNSADERKTATFKWVGQSFAVYISLEDDVKAWFDEHKYYNPYSNTCIENNVCGHYAQLVWANTTDVGCGWKECRYENYDLKYLVCHYGPGANSPSFAT